MGMVEADNKDGVEREATDSPKERGKVADTMAADTMAADTTSICGR